jgi:hypothetical protein
MAMEEPNITITTVKMWKGKKNVMEEDKQLCKFTCCRILSQGMGRRIKHVGNELNNITTKVNCKLQRVPC